MDVLLAVFTGPLLSEDAQTLSDVKHLVNVLYSTLHIEEYQLQRERDIMKRLEDLNTQIAPLEQVGGNLPCLVLSTCGYRVL